MKKFILVSTLFLAAILLFCSCNNKSNKYYEQNSIVMDTDVTLKASGDNSKKAVTDSIKRLQQIDDMASSNNQNSDVSKINNAAGKNYIKVHSEIMKMVETSVEYSKLTNGAWDITIGPLKDLWAIGTSKERVPTDAEIKDKLSLVGYERIRIDKDNSSIMLANEGMSIDLGGIAKGFAVDEVLKIYKKYNISNGLINLGGSSIYTLGKNSKNNLWRIGIKHPRKKDSNNYLGIVSLSNKALSTSGDYERFFISGGKRYHHILDPKTGYPSDSGVISDSIIVNGDIPDNSMIADLLTTAVFVMGADKGLNFIKNIPGVNCQITTSDYKIYATAEFLKSFSDINKEFSIKN